MTPTQGPFIGHENERVVCFGKRHKIAVRFKRIDGWWHAHELLLPIPKRHIREAKDAVRARLMFLRRLTKEDK